MHLTNCRGHLLDGANPFTNKLARQESLVDQLHRSFIVRLTPDSPKMFAANFHELRIQCSSEFCATARLTSERLLKNESLNVWSSAFTRLQRKDRLKAELQTT